MELVIEKQVSQLGILSKKTSYQLKVFTRLAPLDTYNIKRYKAGGIVLSPSCLKDAHNLANIELTINDLLVGKTFVSNNISETLLIEESIKESCHRLKVVLEWLTTFEQTTLTQF